VRAVDAALAQCHPLTFACGTGSKALGG
jgi:hypothetical protein